MTYSRARGRTVAAGLSVLAALAFTGAPAGAAPRGPVLDLIGPAFSAERVDATEGGASVHLTWTVTNADKKAADVTGAVELRRVVGSAAVGPAVSVTYALQSGTGADVPAESGDAQRSQYDYTFVVPQYGSAATAVWRVTKVTAKDNRGHRRTLGAAELERRGARFTAVQRVDTAAPSTDRVGLAHDQPRAVFDPGSGVSLKYEFYVTDDGAGLWKGRIVLAGPSGRRAAAPFEVKDVGNGTPECGEDNPVYDPTSAWCSVTVPLPAGSPSGSWTVAQLSLTDNAANTRTLDAATAPTVRVSRNDVLSARGFAVTPAVVDNWRAPKTTELVFTPSGSVGGLVSVELDTSWCWATSTTPTIKEDGTASVEIQLPTSSSGCQIKGIALKDAAGNEAFYGTSHRAPDLGLAVTRVPDTSPPAVVSAVLNKSTWTQSELNAAWGIGLTVMVENATGAPVTGFSTTLFTAEDISTGGGSGGIHEGADGKLGLSIHARGLEPGEYTVGFTVTDEAGNSTSLGYPNRPAPPGGPIVLTVIPG